MNIVLDHSADRAVWRGYHVEPEDPVLICDDVVDYQKEDLPAHDIQDWVLQPCPHLCPIHIELEHNLWWWKG